MCKSPYLIPALEKPVSKLIVHHSALLNARFDLSMVETRLFMTMLACMALSKSELLEMRIPLTEIVALSRRWLGGKGYQ
ncbi:hypothetical protein N008_20100 [Hymenobacter sp. APR13]|nr:hypothetical protein N008_20100 [Hymenobacter sp. APR13]